MNVEDRVIIPGYIYFRDNGMDYKFGLTNNPVVRGRAYKTENPRDTVLDVFKSDTYAEAETIENEMKTVARSEGLCSFENSDEWIKRLEQSKEFWGRFVLKYAKKTYSEWQPKLQEEKQRLLAIISTREKEIAELKRLATQELYLCQKRAYCPARCNCGKYDHIKYRGMICEICGSKVSPEHQVPNPLDLEVLKRYEVKPDWGAFSYSRTKPYPRGRKTFLQKSAKAYRKFISNLVIRST